jgi:hypothetical protein
MGYTHYFYRAQQDLDPQTFQQFVADCKAVCLKSEIPIANWEGKGKPSFTRTKVSFNGVERCGHAARDLGIVWPSHSPTRGGMAADAPPTGEWVVKSAALSFAGASVSTRTCDGSCAHETFLIEQRYTPYQGQQLKPGEPIFACCKTAYKPYDALVTACLIILKHYFGAQVTVSSDGEDHDWEDARQLCWHVLGYGKDFVLGEE